MPRSENEDPSDDYLLLRHYGTDKERGDESAYEELYARHADYLMQQLTTYDPDVAEAASQWAWKRLHLRWEKVEQGNIRAWLIKTAKNYANNAWRKERATKRGGGKKRQDATADIGDTRAVDPMQALRNAEDVERLRAAIAQLPDDERALIELAYDLEMTGAEIAAKLAIPQGTVKSRLNRARMKLRTLLERD